MKAAVREIQKVEVVVGVQGAGGAGKTVMGVEGGQELGGEWR